MNATLNAELIEFYSAITPNNNETFGYSLANVKEFKMVYGIAWQANIKLNGKKIGEVSCDGNGGCYRYFFKNYADELQFHLMVSKAYAGRKMVDVEEDCFINFLDYKMQVK